MSLQGKVAMVTGGGTGLGRLMARALLDAGAAVAVTGRRREPLDAFVAETANAADAVLALACDVRSMTQVRSAVEAVQQWRGHIDILVNNAAVFPPGFATLIDEQQWVEVIDTNLNGAFRMAQACAPGMIRNRWGRIVNVVSPSGVVGMATVPAYGTSKGALMAFTRHLAVELGRFGITVNGLCPGIVATEKFIETFSADVPDAVGEALPIGRANRPEDFIGPLLLLVSDAGAGITGSTLFVDGGLSSTAPLSAQQITLLDEHLGGL